MNSRERFLACMRYQPLDRAPYSKFLSVGWPETHELWKSQGWDEGAYAQFGFDRWEVYGGWFFPNPPFEKKTLAEDEETITYVNQEGIVMRELKKNPLSSMPQFVHFPVETREDFRKFWKERMQPNMETRIGPDWQARLRAFRNRDFPLIVISDRWGGMFGPLRNLVGVEKLCLLFYDDPAFVEEMMEANAEFIITVMGRILDQTDVDVFGFWEDMAYKTGPLIAPEMFRRFALPRYRRVVDYLHSRGVEFISLDSDGNIWSLIPVWLEAGINILYPFEVQAGMDVLAVRRKFGSSLRIWCGVDKRTLAQGPKAIDAELARLAPLVEEGGYIPMLDHTVPPDVSYANYCYYIKKVQEILG